MKGKILSCGGFLPGDPLTNEELSKKVDTTDEWIQTRTGIKQRYIMPSGQYVTDMAFEASLIAIENLKNDKSLSEEERSEKAIDGIIFSTSTQDLCFPSSACILQGMLKKKGIKVEGFAFDVIAACAGFVHGVTLANSMINSGLGKRILVIGADAVSRALNWEDRATCVLFGDGAGAVIIEAVSDENESGIIACELKADGDFTEILRTNRGVITETDEKLKILMDGKAVYVHAIEKMTSSIVNLIHKGNLEKKDIDWIIPHQANARILEAVAKRLEMPMEKFVVTIDRHANTSAGTIPLALWETLKTGKIKRGETMIFEALGGGLAWGGVLLRW